MVMKQRGFSLIELVITITVLSILTLGVLPLVKVSVKRQKEQELRDALLSTVLLEEAFPAEEDEYGQRYMLDFEMSTEAGSASVRSGWIVRSREDFPRFTTCWVL